MTPRIITPAATADHNLLATDNALLAFFELQVPTDPPTRYRLVHNNEPITWRGFTYSPAEIELGEVEEDAEGGINPVQLRIQAVTREFVQLLEAYDMTGQPVTAYIVNQADLTSGQPVTVDHFAIQSFEFNETTITATLGQWGLYEGAFPSEIVKRSGCPVQYRGPRCGYVGALPKCDKTETGPNGCEAHGNQARFGGEPLTPRQSGLGVKS